MEGRIDMYGGGVHMFDLCEIILAQLYRDLEPLDALRFMETCPLMFKMCSPMHGAVIFACTRTCCSGQPNPLPVSAWMSIWSKCAAAVEAEGWPRSAWLNSCWRAAYCDDGNSYYHLMDLAEYEGPVIDIDDDSTHVLQGGANVDTACVQLRAELEAGSWLMAFSETCSGGIFSETLAGDFYLCAELILLESGRFVHLKVEADDDDEDRNVALMIIGSDLRSVWSKYKNIDVDGGVASYECKSLRLVPHFSHQRVVQEYGAGRVTEYYASRRHDVRLPKVVKHLNNATKTRDFDAFRALVDVDSPDALTPFSNLTRLMAEFEILVG